MVKEFQQLRKQMTQRLLEQQEQQKEISALVAKQEREKKEWLLDLIELVEKLSRKESILEQSLQVKVLPKHDSQEIYNNIQSDLILLLSKYGVQPIVENGRLKEDGVDEINKTLKDATLPRKRFTYRGEILKK